MKFILSLVAILLMILVCALTTIYLNVWVGIGLTIVFAIGLIKFFDSIETPNYKRDENIL